MGKLHRTNAGYLGVSMEETQDPFWTYNRLALALSQGETVAGSNGGLPVYNTTDAFGTVKGSGTRTDAFASSIVLAVPMNGTSGGTTFTDESANIKGSGAAKSITVNGNVQTGTSISKFYGSSAAYDGNGDYLSLASSADFQLWNSTAWTVECYIYINSLASSFYFFGAGNRASTTTRCMLSINTSGHVTVDWDGTSSDATTVFTTGLSTGRWYHIAAVSDGTILRVYIDGAAMPQTATLGTSTQANAPISIGVPGVASNPATYTGLNGYLQDFRIYKGVAKYTSNFIVPESGPSTFDRSPSRKAVGNAGATWQTSVSKFYGGATVFNSSNTDTKKVVASSVDFAFGTQDFTVEAWIYIRNHKDYNCIITTRPNNGGYSDAWHIGTNSTGRLEFYGGSYDAFTSNGAVTAGTWTHIAAVKAGTTLTLFVNGSPGGSGSFSRNLTRELLGIGQFPSQDSEGFDGYIQDVRIYKGIAKYTSSFIPPARSLVQTARRYPSGMHVLS